MPQFDGPMRHDNNRPNKNNTCRRFPFKWGADLGFVLVFLSHLRQFALIVRRTGLWDCTPCEIKKKNEINWNQNDDDCIRFTLSSLSCPPPAQQQGRRTAPCSYLLFLSFFISLFLSFFFTNYFLSFCLSPLTLRATQKKSPPKQK